MPSGRRAWFHHPNPNRRQPLSANGPHPSLESETQRKGCEFANRQANHPNPRQGVSTQQGRSMRRYHIMRESPRTSPNHEHPPNKEPDPRASKRRKIKPPSISSHMNRKRQPRTNYPLWKCGTSGKGRNASVQPQTGTLVSSDRFKQSAFRFSVTWFANSPQGNRRQGHNPVGFILKGRNQKDLWLPRFRRPTQLPTGTPATRAAFGLADLDLFALQGGKNRIGCFLETCRKS